MIKHDFRQAMCNLYFPCAVIALVVFLVYGDYEDIFYGGSDGLLGMLQYSVTLSYLPYLIPVLVVMPYAGCLQEELHSGYRYSTLSRSNRRAYLRGKIVTAFFSGVLVMLLSILIFLLIAGSVSYYGFSIGGYEIFGQYGTLQRLFNMKMPGVVLILKIFLLLLYAGYWSLLSLLCVLLVKNQYLALALPFFINLVTRYCAMSLGLYVLHPYYHTLSLGVQFPNAPLGGVPISVGYYLISYVVFGWLFCKKMKEVWNDE